MRSFISTIDFAPVQSAGGNVTLRIEEEHDGVSVPGDVRTLSVYEGTIPVDDTGSAVRDLIRAHYGANSLTLWQCHGWVTLFQHDHSMVVVMRHDFDS